MLDLHTHSNCSDGQHSPSELLSLAANLGITHFAITDHDTVDGMQEASHAAQSLDIRFLCGIEISTSRSHQHLLGLDINPNNPALRIACDGFKKRRTARVQGILKVLNAWGMDITEADVRVFANGQIGRPHFARAMVAKGYVQSVPEAFERYLKSREIRAVNDEKPDVKDAIALVHEAGGLAVLAHPMELSLPFDALERHLDTLCDCGLDGIEAFYKSNAPMETDFLLRYAQKNDLLVTGGSDFHGVLVKPSITLGIPAQDEILRQERLWLRK